MSRSQTDQSLTLAPAVVAAILIGILLAVALGLVITTGGFGLFTDDMENDAPAAVNDTTDDSVETDDDSEPDETNEDDVTDDETDTQDVTDDEARDESESTDDTDSVDDGDESGTDGADTTPSDDESGEEAINDGMDEDTDDGDDGNGDEDDTAIDEDTVESDEGAEDDEGGTDDMDEEAPDDGDEGDDTGADPGEPGPDMSTLTVEVVTDDTGEPIESEVRLRGPADDQSDLDESEERTRLTGEDGTVTFEDLDNGYYEVYADPVEYDVNNAGLYFWEPIEIDGSDVTTTHELPPAPRDHTLTFEVTDNRTEEPIEEATVEVFFVYIWNGADMKLEETTDTTGTAIVDVVNTAVNYEVDAPGYEAESGSLDVEENQTIAIDLDPDEPEPHTLTVQIVGENAEPLQSEVTISDPDTGNVIAVKDTDEDGSVRFDLTDGQYHVEADPGYEISEEYSGEVIEISGSDETIVHEVPPEREMIELAVVDMQVDVGHDTAREYIVFENQNDQPLDLGGYVVTDRADGTGIEAVFPDGFTLDPGEQVRVTSGEGEPTDDEIFMNSGRAVWREDGDIILVLNPDGEVAFRHPYGDEGEGADSIIAHRLGFSRSGPSRFGLHRF